MAVRDALCWPWVDFRGLGEDSVDCVSFRPSLNSVVFSKTFPTVEQQGNELDIVPPVYTWRPAALHVCEPQKCAFKSTNPGLDCCLLMEAQDAGVHTFLNTRHRGWHRKLWNLVSTST